jgi:hypothetical protein
MEWSGQKSFVSSHEQSFVVDGTEAGVLKSHGALNFLKVEIRQPFSPRLVFYCSYTLYFPQKLCLTYVPR